MKKFIAAVLFLLMLACAALAKARHPDGLSPVPEAKFLITAPIAQKQNHKLKTPAPPAGVFSLSGLQKTG